MFVLALPELTARHFFLAPAPLVRFLEGEFRVKSVIMDFFSRFALETISESDLRHLWLRIAICVKVCLAPSTT